jgi:exodeoxyribonuclease VII small subunit
MKIDELDFEKALQKLEEVVKQLEDENISLEDSMQKFEQ